jgi:hypothetical protein
VALAPVSDPTSNCHLCSSNTITRHDRLLQQSLINSDGEPHLTVPTAQQANKTRPHHATVSVPTASGPLVRKGRGGNKRGRKRGDRQETRKEKEEERRNCIDAAGEKRGGCFLFVDHIGFSNRGVPVWRQLVPCMSQVSVYMHELLHGPALLEETLECTRSVSFMAARVCLCSKC